MTGSEQKESLVLPMVKKLLASLLLLGSLVAIMTAVLYNSENPVEQRLIEHNKRSMESIEENVIFRLFKFYEVADDIGCEGFTSCSECWDALKTPIPTASPTLSPRPTLVSEMVEEESGPSGPPGSGPGGRRLQPSFMQDDGPLLDPPNLAPNPEMWFLGESSAVQCDGEHGVGMSDNCRLYCKLAQPTADQVMRT